MDINHLFNSLDTDGDGELSREDIRKAAKFLGWSWREAPVFAVLDFLTVNHSLSAEDFFACMRQMSEDPLGPYGRVLANTSDFYHSKIASTKPKAGAENNEIKISSLPESMGDSEASDRYRGLLADLNKGGPEIPLDDSTLLVIDPQVSFTRGAWKQSIGVNANMEVRPICAAFDNCAERLRKHYHRVETMFTRCPFPPSSYEWDDRLADIIAGNQPYFIKPGNSALWPPTNGFKKWIDFIIEKKKKYLVIGGCTLNSCVRVSAIGAQQYAEKRNLQVVVDLEITGARSGNYRPASRFGGAAPVEAAVREMLKAGVWVVDCVGWE